MASPFLLPETTYRRALNTPNRNKIAIITTNRCQGARSAQPSNKPARYIAASVPTKPHTSRWSFVTAV
jgi:hypothetical protein